MKEVKKESEKSGRRTSLATRKRKNVQRAENSSMAASRIAGALRFRRGSLSCSQQKKNDQKKLFPVEGLNATTNTADPPQSGSAGSESEQPRRI